ncbi:hypothetical protein A8H35_06295 [Burkholderia thailandensis]|nr:hypothetical protein A8H31_16975 [Burkholderia thailandensis]AWY58107.1 hypothetical protein A8H35_06295 [Burkholderia thailandensis]AWY67719.1 hypothetical protein A8H36_22035 [Burkholderia thailandensis]NOK41544.1 hypothetical protein [Burkholderia thailandensis]NOK52695.1 hypothetical protein [Burkholderia thailandensis]
MSPRAIRSAAALPNSVSEFSLYAPLKPTSATVFMSRFATPCLTSGIDSRISSGRTSRPGTRFASNDSTLAAVAADEIARAGHGATMPPIAGEHGKTVERISASPRFSLANRQAWLIPCADSAGSPKATQPAARSPISFGGGALKFVS